MNEHAAAWRAMHRDDLDAVLAIAERVHPDFPEERAVFADRLAIFPDGCWCLEMGGRIAGYLVSHPARMDEPPPLDTVLGCIAPDADGYYIHDLALLPEARGAGAGAGAIETVFAIAQERGFAQVGLVAVGGSAPFWASRGFEPAADAVLDGKVAGYGAQSRFMRRSVPAV